MLNAIFSQKLNTQSKTVNNAVITLGDTDDTGKGRKFKSRFIQPGIAGYPGQFGNVLIRKETLDKFINTLVGSPVIINHKNLTVKNADENRVGVVSNVWYDNKDGWYWCDGVIWDKTAQNLITDKGWSVSCSYDVTLADDAGGTENNIKYDIEFLDGVFTHLAIVNNPRYERANIVLNSKTAICNGGSGSGNYNHAGIPGQVGGSTKRDINSDKEKFNNEINKIKSGEYPRSKQITVTSRPSKAWLDVGLKDAEIVMPVAVYLKATKEKHSVDEETIRNFPELLEDPPFIFKSSTEEGSFVGVLDAIEKDKGEDKPLIVAVKPVDKRIEVNIITSTYGKDRNFISREIAKGNLLYRRKKTISNSVVASIATEASRLSSNIINNYSEDFNPNVNKYEQKRKKEMEVLDKIRELVLNVDNNCEVDNNRWITIHPHGEDGSGRHLKLQDGETPREAIDRVYKKPEKSEKDSKKKDETNSLRKKYEKLIYHPRTQKHLYDSIEAQKWEAMSRGRLPKVGDTVIDPDGLSARFTHGLSLEEYNKFNWDEAEEAIFEELHKLESEAGFIDENGSPEQKEKTKALQKQFEKEWKEYDQYWEEQAAKKEAEKKKTKPPKSPKQLAFDFTRKIQNSLEAIIDSYAAGEIEKSKYDLKILKGLRNIINECGL